MASSGPLIIKKRRTNVIPVRLAYSVEGDYVTSQIRQGRSVRSDLIATFNVTIMPGSGGRILLLKLDNLITSAHPVVNASMGYMDIKRMSAGEPLDIINSPVPVVFQDVVTS